MRRLWALGFALCAVTTTPPLAAQGSDSAAVAARTRAVAAALRCPVCQGLSIQDSPSPLAQEMRDIIRDQIRAGKSDEQVKQYFVQKYGEWILLEPPARGFNLAVYVLPALLLMAGAAFVLYLTRKWSRGRRQVADEREVFAGE